MNLKPFKEQTRAEKVVDFVCVVLAVGIMLMTGLIIIFNVGR